jgi:hypothetical protein
MDENHYILSTTQFSRVLMVGYPIPFDLSYTTPTIFDITRL